MKEPLFPTTLIGAKAQNLTKEQVATLSSKGDDWKKDGDIFKAIKPQE